jgi:predicted AlkP superfamily pyrophosphatase or phosphodiesterase
MSWPAPDYEGRCLTQVLPSALAVLERRTPVLPLPRADRIVVLLVDALGLWPAPRPESAPFLSGMAQLEPGGIDAVFPSTTAASLTSLGTGLPPGAHGIVGASFWLPETDGMLYPLGWRNSPNPLAVQPEPTVLERASQRGIAVTVVGQRAFAGSGLTIAALRGGKHVGADSPGETVMAVAQAAAARPPGLVYGYFSTVDKSGHVHGVDSPQQRLDLAHVDLAVLQIARRLPAGTLLLVTGDHGMIDCPDSGRIDIDAAPLSTSVARLAGEPRMRHVYLRRDVQPGEAADRWRRHLGDRAVVVTRSEAIAAGWFGGDVRHDVAQRIGDLLALPLRDGSLTSSADSIVSGLRGQHGGLTEQERKVPLLAWQA